MTTLDLAGALADALRDPAVRAELVSLVQTAVLKTAESRSTAARFETIPAYAVRHGVCRRTVGHWLKRGLPHEKIGRVVRIATEKADAWLGDDVREREIEARAQKDAAKARGRHRAG